MGYLCTLAILLWFVYDFSGNSSDFWFAMGFLIGLALVFLGVGLCMMGWEWFRNTDKHGNPYWDRRKD